MILLLSFPLMLLIGIAIFIQLKEFPLFFQERGITLTKARFRIIKFRTMKSHSIINNKIAEDHILNKPELAPLLTNFTSWLRRTGLDELPQLFNVIIGDMSLIGPRPLMINDLELLKEKYPEAYKKRGKLSNKPGISGLWQIFGERNKGIDNLLKLENEYENLISFSYDFYLLLNTIPIIFYAKHSDAVPNEKSKKSRLNFDLDPNLLEEY